MKPAEIVVLQLESEYYGKSFAADKTLFFNEAAANSLGSPPQLKSPTSLILAVGPKQSQMYSVVLSLPTPDGNVLRMSRKALQAFRLKNGHRYWMEWNASTKELRIYS